MEEIQEENESTGSLSNFVLGHTLHNGAFTTIRVVKEKRNDQVLVLKSVDKAQHIMQNTNFLLDAELDILSKNASEWIVGFNYYFQDSNTAYFIIEYLPGGDFVSLLESNGGSMKESVAIFYLGELVLAINAVHSTGYSHRNIKPANILMDANGHIKLTGFGSASKLCPDGKVSTTIAVDSASYEAPEILRTLGNETYSYGIECDFWSLGVIACEIINGDHPFRSSSPLSAFKKITAKKTKGSIKISPKVSKDCQDFITGLLLEQDERLDYHGCIKHSFFNDLIWDGLRNEEPPLKPVMNPDDTKFGDEKELDEDDEGADENSSEPNNMNKTLRKLKPDNTNKTFNTTFCFPRSARDKQNFENTSIWSVSAAVDSPYTIKKRPLRHLSSEEDIRLKSELQLKTEQLMEKLNEIKILQDRLEKTQESLNAKEKLLTNSTKENQRYKSELHLLTAQLSNEKNSRELLETKLINLQKSKIATGNLTISTSKLNSITQEEGDSNEVFELKEQVINLMDIGAQKDDIILELTIQSKILRHDLKIQELQNQCLLRREEADADVFAESYKEMVKELEYKLNSLETLLSFKPDNNDQRSKDFIKSYRQGLSHLGQKIEECHSSSKKNMEDVKLKRKKYAESFGKIQVALDNALEKYSD